MAGTIRAQIKLDGGQAFANDFKKAASAVSAANSELKYLDTELKKNGQSTEALSKKTEAVNKAWKAEQDTIDQLTSRIEELNNMTGEDTTEAVNQLTAELYKHKKAQAELGESIEETGDDFGDLADDIALAQATMDTFKDIAVSLAKEIWNLGKDAVQYNAQMESYQKTIEAFFKTSGMSADQASKATKELIANQKELSTVVGLGADKLIDANKMLIAAGVNGERSQEAIAGLAKAIVAVGGGNEEFNRMASNLQQIQSVGKAAAADMKQFSMAGVDVYSLIADQTGKSVEQLKEMDITFDMIVDALTAATSEGGRFFEAAQVGAQTLQGQTALLETTWREGLGTAFEPVNQALSEKLIPAAQNLVENVDWESIGTAMETAVEGASKLVEVISWFYDNFSKAVDDNREQQAKAMLELASDSDEVKQKVFGDMSDAAHESGRLILSDLTDLQTGHNEAMDKMIEGTMKYSDKLPQLTNQVKEELNEKLPSVFEEMNKASETWGFELATGYAEGMLRGIPQIQAAADKAAEAAAGPLHFSRPDYGPLRDYDKWMPEFVSGLAKGIEDSEWMLADASADLAQTITNNTITNNVSMAVYGTAGQSADDIANVVMLKIQQATNSRRAVWA
jgi:tape measure domain-containing protein